MDEFIRELEEDLEREKWYRLWRQYGRFIIGGAAAIILLTIFGVAWNEYKRSQNAEQTALLLQNLSIEKPIDPNLKGEHKAIAHLAHAAAYVQQGKLEEAYKLYSEAAAKDQQSFAGSVASMMQNALHVELKKEEATDVSTKGFFTAEREELKAWQLLAAGKNAEASAIFSKLAFDDEVPMTLRDRASQLHAYLTADDVLERHAK